MSAPLSRLLALACAVLVLGAATTASARPKKHGAEKHGAEKHSAERAATATTNCYGTPIIMQGMDCPKRSARGSAGSYAPARLSTPSLPLSQPSTGVYIPPPVSNPSAQINQLNHSFPLNGGLGLNPTNRDAYIRYNLTK